MLYFVPLVIVDIFVIEAASGTMAVIKIAVLEQDLKQIIKLDNILSGCYIGMIVDVIQDYSLIVIMVKI